MKARFPMSLEVLESRIAPAGIVTVETVGGVLELTGDDGGAEIMIEQIGAKKFLITGIDTQLQGPDGLTTELIVSKISSIEGTFGGGNDDIEIRDAKLKSLKLDLGNGNNVATVVTGKIAGAASVTGGSGSDSVSLTGISWTSKSFRGELGEGSNLVNFDADTVKAGSVTVLGGIGVDLFSVSSATAKFKDVDLEFGDGNNRVKLFAPNLSLSNLSFTGGIGNDRIDSTVDRLTMKSARLTMGSGDNTIDVEGSTTKIKGSLSITQANAESPSGSTISIDNGGVFSVGKDFTIENGAGKFTNDLETSTLNVGGNFLVKHSGVEGSAQTTSLVARQALTVKGDLKIENLDGRNETSIYGSAALKVLGKTAFTQGNHAGPGRPEFLLSSDGAISLKKVDLVSGDSSVDLEFSDAAKLTTGDINAKTGDGRLSLEFAVNVIQTKGDITMAAGVGSELTFRDHLQLSVSGDLNLLGASNLRVYGYSGTVQGDVNAGNVDLIPGKSFMIGGDLKVLAPSDSGMLSNLYRTMVKGGTTITAGDTSSTIFVVDSTFRGSFALTTGSDLDIVLIEGNSEFTRPVTIDLGAGDDDLSIGTADSPKFTTFHDTVTLTGGTGANELRIDPKTVFKDGEPTSTGWAID